MSWTISTRLGLIAIAVALACSCGGKQSRGSGDKNLSEQQVADAGVIDAFVPTGPGLVFSVSPETAEVIVDGESLGEASRLMADGFLEVEPGIHQITIRADGFETWRAEVTIRESPDRIEVELEPTE